MDFSKMYEFGGNINGGLHAGLSTITMAEYQMFGSDEVDFSVFTGKRILSKDKPFLFSHNSGKVPKDIITTGMTNISMLISEKVVSAFKKHNLTGWSTYPIKVFGKDKKEIPGYYGLVVTGKCGPIDATKSRTCWQEIFDDRIIAEREGSYFDPKTWDGKDFFISTTNSVVMVTEKVKNVFKLEKLTNAEFCKLNECKISAVIGINKDKVDYESKIVPKPENWPNEHTDEYPPCKLWHWKKK